MENRRHKRKGLVRKREIIVLAIFVSSAVLLLAATNSFRVLARTLNLKPVGIALPFVSKEAKQKSRYDSGQKVQISSGKKLADYQNWIGTIKKVKSTETSQRKLAYSYEIKFDNGRTIKHVRESDLAKTKKSTYHQGQVVKLKSSAKENLKGRSLSDYQTSAGRVDQVSYNHSSAAGGYKYDITFDDGGKVTDIQEGDLETIYQVKLKAENSAAQNNDVLRQAFAYAKEHPGTILGLPSGKFKIGSQTPNKDYLTLASNTEIRGDNTTLLVEGAAYWFALATGPKATDGVKNFTMRNLNIKASDLDKGNHFMIMANHGDHWRVLNNSFTMVHKKGSHVFDMGGLQNSTFKGNQFTGYAPELVNAKQIDANTSLHDYYSEAIQLDASSDNGVWDGGLIKAIDPNYSSHNKEKQLSRNIVVTDNSFVPYYDSKGNIKAYSGSVGQHSSDVGPIKIYNNVFSNTLVGRISVNEKDKLWLFKAVHLKLERKGTVYDNDID
ncbi:HlyD family secretion protein [Streptococcus ratti]|uniref:HlyD family secretion protein n=1 Tax=Streptococcus ratti TaxID=1341 RepID=A0A7X9LEV2_STRRT|nr:HlyD family secretion protein [Streptococcus ratti]NMD49878.1 HlyD family secretion protein [Streptococcus ratti]